MRYSYDNRPQLLFPNIILVIKKNNLYFFDKISKKLINLLYLNLKISFFLF